MKLQKIIETQFKQIFAFNKQIFPLRPDVEAHFRFLFVDNPLVQDKSKPSGLVAWNDEDEIIGQFMLSPAEFIYQQQKKMCYFGCDYYVAEQYRNSGAGAMLAMQAINGYKPYFTIGASPDAMKISLALKTRHIGDLVKYIRFKNVITPFKIVLNKIKLLSRNTKPAEFMFPAVIKVNEYTLKKADQPQHWPEENADPACVEFSRNREFCQWRFFSQPDKYIVYQVEQLPAYMVCRLLEWHGLCLLALVDYRVSSTDKCEFTTLLKAAEKIAAVAGLDGVLTMSSRAFFDKLLQKNKFFKTGRLQPILTNAKLELDPEKINNRDIILATMADCDMDLNM